MDEFMKTHCSNCCCDLPGGGICDECKSQIAGATVRCSKCGKVPGEWPRQKYCGDGSDKDNSHTYVLIEKPYLVQNLHQGYLGNSPFFWQEGNSGYTAEVDQAKRFSHEESLAMIERDPHKWRRWKLEHVMQCLVTVCDIQPLRRLVE